LLASCIVRTFDKSLTAVDIIKFTEEDEMKYLIIEHSSDNNFRFIIHESNKHTSAISVVQDIEEFMVMGWKVAKVIPTWVLGFVDRNNLMTTYKATLRQDVKIVNTNDVFNAKNINVGNNDDADSLYVGDGLVQGDDPQKIDNHNVINEANSTKKGCSGYK
jgi:hypothetical protein